MIILAKQTHRRDFMNKIMALLGPWGAATPRTRWSLKRPEEVPPWR